MVRSLRRSPLPTRAVRSGGVLLHDGGGDRSGTVEAVDRVIPQLLGHGYRFDRPAPVG